MKQRRKGRLAIMQPCIRYYPHPVSFLYKFFYYFSPFHGQNLSSPLACLCVIMHVSLKHILPGKRLKSNIAITRLVCSLLFTLVTVMWTLCIMMQAGDIHPNPGPATASTSSFSSLASVSSAFNFSKLSITYLSCIIMSRVWCQNLTC